MTTCAPFGVYSMERVVVSIDGRKVIGFAEGDDAVLIEDTTELGTEIVGADGSSLLSITADRSAKITLKLLASSPFNQFLQNKVDVMRSGTGLAGAMAVGVLDTSMGYSGGCTTAMVMKKPNIGYGANPTEREWVIFCPCWTPSETTFNAA